MDADCLRMAIHFSGDLVGRLADPAQQHHLCVVFPIGRRVMAPGQFAHLALFLLILRCSRFDLLGHLCAPPSSDHLPSILSPMRNAAVLAMAPTIIFGSDSLSCSPPSAVCEMVLLLTACHKGKKEHISV